jgi:hypothetical protein
VEFLIQIFQVTQITGPEWIQKEQGKHNY